MKKSIKSSLILLFVLVFNLNFYAQNDTNESEEIKSLIAKKRAFNDIYGYGFRIQIYNGSEQQSRKLRARFRATFPGYATKLVYDAPEWKVQVGNYKTKLEAGRDLVVFKKKFSGIIIIPMGK